MVQQCSHCRQWQTGQLQLAAILPTAPPSEALSPGWRKNQTSITCTMSEKCTVYALHDDGLWTETQDLGTGLMTNRCPALQQRFAVCHVAIPTSGWKAVGSMPRHSKATTGTHLPSSSSVCTKATAITPERCKRVAAASVQAVETA